MVCERRCREGRLGDHRTNHRRRGKKKRQILGVGLEKHAVGESVEKLEEFVGEHVAEEPAGVLHRSEAQNFFAARIQALHCCESEMKSWDFDGRVADFENFFFV